MMFVEQSLAFPGSAKNDYIVHWTKKFFCWIKKEEQMTLLQTIIFSQSFVSDLQVKCVEEYNIYIPQLWILCLVNTSL